MGITYKGELVVYLWGGFKDKDQKAHWEEDTIVNVWSSTKNMASLCMYVLAEKGLINFHDPVIKYWPEFSNKGKKDILISQVMSHSSGLSGWKEPIEYTDFYKDSSLELESYMNPAPGNNLRLLDVDNRTVLPYLTQVRVLATRTDVLHA